MFYEICDCRQHTQRFSPFVPFAARLRDCGEGKKRLQSYHDKRIICGKSQLRCNYARYLALTTVRIADFRFDNTIYNNNNNKDIQQKRDIKF